MNFYELSYSCCNNTDLYNFSKDIYVTWKKPDGSAIRLIDNRFQTATSELLISNVQKTDEGIYTCIGTGDNLPAAKATINLQIECE